MEDWRDFGGIGGTSMEDCREFGGLEGLCVGLEALWWIVETSGVGGSLMVYRDIEVWRGILRIGGTLRMDPAEGHCNTMYCTIMINQCKAIRGAPCIKMFPMTRTSSWKG